MINAEIIQNQNHAEEPMCLSHEPLGSSLLIISQLRAVSSHIMWSCRVPKMLSE